jgi:hypothetical protein
MRTEAFLVEQHRCLVQLDVRHPRGAGPGLEEAARLADVRGQRSPSLVL